MEGESGPTESVNAVAGMMIIPSDNDHHHQMMVYEESLLDHEKQRQDPVYPFRIEDRVIPSYPSVTERYYEPRFFIPSPSLLASKQNVGDQCVLFHSNRYVSWPFSLSLSLTLFTSSFSIIHLVFIDSFHVHKVHGNHAFWSSSCFIFKKIPWWSV